MTIRKEKKLEDIKALFYFAYKTFTEEPDHILVKYGIQRMHHRILYFVAHLPGLSINELLTLLEISKQALNSPLRKLIEKGLITSVPSKQDLRVRQLNLTKEGDELEKKLSYAQSGVLNNIFDELGEEYLNSWMKVMEKFASSRPGNDLWCSEKRIK